MFLMENKSERTREIYAISYTMLPTSCKTILNSFKLITPVELIALRIVLRHVSIATLVFPAPVGAATSKFYLNSRLLQKQLIVTYLRTYSSMYSHI